MPCLAKTRNSQFFGQKSSPNFRTPSVNIVLLHHQVIKSDFTASWSKKCDDVILTGYAVIENGSLLNYDNLSISNKYMIEVYHEKFPIIISSTLEI